ncbi:Por secretion system C-terminal sorting domain-containing protein [Catalinimonas alkaloidigena]|uniref:Por secretion system C-terminal sorting domain-containing protein n=1 Tax=Catalinimonas alkaloidigena TaxID=1075417 RepID=A0A1G9VEN7_9BACT|nr:YCF48-related protein [Catalinimonas alkaloidigena]SDM70543.1 Por secretion system C-terminal sorting domain-containing protein [Catalinimonas alkaloidigena]
MTKLYPIALLFLLVRVLSPAVSQDWQWINPMPTGNGPRDVAWPDAQTLYAAGDKGQFFASPDFGATWQANTMPTEADVMSLYFVDAERGYAVTNAGEIWHTTDAGQTWALQFTDPGGTTFRDLHFFGDSIGYAVGDAGFADNLLFYTHDGGTTWVSATLPRRTSASFYGLFFVKALSADTVVAASWDNTFFQSFDRGLTWDTTGLPASPAGFYEGGYFVNDSTGFLVGPNAYVQKTTDRGAHWEQKLGGADSLEQARHYFSEVFFLNDTVGWVSSFSCLYKTRDGGDTWERTCEGTYGSGRKSYIRFLDETTGVALSSQLYTTTDGWNFQTVLPTGPLNTWYRFEEVEGDLYAVGSGGNLFHGTKDGAAWQLLSTPTQATLRGIDFVDPMQGWVAGSDSAVFKTADGGQTWEGVETPFQGNFNDLHAWSMQEVLVIGTSGSVLKTADGGETWAFTSLDSLKQLNAVYFPQPDTGYVVGASGLVARTLDGGQTWALQESGLLSHLNDVFFVDGTTGYAVGSLGKILVTYDAGATWQSQVSGQSGTLNAIFFLDADHGYVTGSGVLLVTDDGGQTWEEQYLPASGYLSDLVFLTPGQGWVVGAFGSVLRYNQPLTGLEDEVSRQAVTLRVFPNPASSQTTLVLPTPYTGQGYLQLIDASGRQVYQRNLAFTAGETRWSIPPGLDRGIYFVQVVTPDSRQTGRLYLHP